MKFPAEAAPFFVLQLQQARGKLMERLFGLFAFCDVRKCVDYCGNRAVRRKLWHGTPQSPKNLIGVIPTPADHFTLNRLARRRFSGSRPHPKKGLCSRLP